MTVYVGDRPEDIEMGRQVGTYTVAVESEYGPRRLLEDAEPDLLLPHAGHLPDRFRPRVSTDVIGCERSERAGAFSASEGLARPEAGRVAKKVGARDIKRCRE